jgi:hypothetical protein
MEVFAKVIVKKCKAGSDPRLLEEVGDLVVRTAFRTLEAIAISNLPAPSKPTFPVVFPLEERYNHLNQYSVFALIISKIAKPYHC